MIRPKSQNFKIGHDGILSIGNFILMIKNNILLFQLPGNLPTTKKCAPYFRGNTEFPIYFKHVLSFINDADVKLSDFWVREIKKKNQMRFYKKILTDIDRKKLILTN
jgi:hypothetical protein